MGGETFGWTLSSESRLDSEGDEYLVTLTEGGTGSGGDDSAADQDATSSSYGPGAVNGVAQGVDLTNRFRFTFPKPTGVSAGTELTATARDGSNNTSEFSGRVVAAISIVVSGSGLRGRELRRNCGDLRRRRLVRRCRGR